MANRAREPPITRWQRELNLKTTKNNNNKMTTVIVQKEMEIPVGILVEVADLLIEHEISHKITATDADNDCITLELEYEKEEREIIHEIQDLIDDYEEEDEDGEEDDDR